MSRQQLLLLLWLLFRFAGAVSCLVSSTRCLTALGLVYGSFLSREPSSCVLVVVSVLVLIHHHKLLFCGVRSRWALSRLTGHHIVLSAVSGRQTLQQYVPRILFVAQAHSRSRKWLMLFDRLSCHVGSRLASVPR
jgi:hypothetical protein